MCDFYSFLVWHVHSGYLVLTVFPNSRRLSSFVGECSIILQVLHKVVNLSILVRQGLEKVRYVAEKANNFQF